MDVLYIMIMLEIARLDMFVKTLQIQHLKIIEFYYTYIIKVTLKVMVWLT